MLPTSESVSDGFRRMTHQNPPTTNNTSTQKTIITKGWSTAGPSSDSKSDVELFIESELVGGIKKN